MKQDAAPIKAEHGEITVDKYGKKWVAKTNITAPLKMEFTIGGNSKEEALRRMDDFLSGKPV